MRRAEKCGSMFLRAGQKQEKKQQLPADPCPSWGLLCPRTIENRSADRAFLMIFLYFLVCLCSWACSVTCGSSKVHLCSPLPILMQNRCLTSLDLRKTASPVLIPDIVGLLPTLKDSNLLSAMKHQSAFIFCRHLINSCHVTKKFYTFKKC